MADVSEFSEVKPECAGGSQGDLGWGRPGRTGSSAVYTEPGAGGAGGLGSGTHLRMHSRAWVNTCGAMPCSCCRIRHCSSVTDMAVRSLALLQLVNRTPLRRRQICNRDTGCAQREMPQNGNMLCSRDTGSGWSMVACGNANSPGPAFPLLLLPNSTSGQSQQQKSCHCPWDRLCPRVTVPIPRVTPPPQAVPSRPRLPLLFWGITVCVLTLTTALFQTVPRPSHHIQTCVWALGEGGQQRPPQEVRAALRMPRPQASLQTFLEGIAQTHCLYSPPHLHRWKYLRRASPWPPPPSSSSLRAEQGSGVSALFPSQVGSSQWGSLWAEKRPPQGTFSPTGRTFGGIFFVPLDVSLGTQSPRAESPKTKDFLSLWQLHLAV